MKWQNFRWVLVIVVLISILSAVGVEPGLAASSTQSLQNSALTRIRFVTGATSATVSGNLTAHKTARYVLTAKVGQLMNVTLSAPDGVTLLITATSGQVITPLTSSATGFRGYLPWNGDYILAVTAGSHSISYSLSVSIPVRVSFARGTTSAKVTGHLVAHQSLNYILGAQANQLMEISATPDTNLQLIIYGVDGTVLRSGMGQGASFRSLLPLTEDYLISLRAGDQAVSFTMQVIIPQRITFQPGGISASIQHYLQANRTQYYVLRALKNQTMKVRLTSGDEIQWIIYGADGTVLKSGSSSASSFTGRLLSTQDYVIAVRAAADPVRYQLWVTIR